VQLPVGSGSAPAPPIRCLTARVLWQVCSCWWRVQRLGSVMGRSVRAVRGSPQPPARVRTLAVAGRADRGTRDEHRLARTAVASVLVRIIRAAVPDPRIPGAGETVSQVVTTRVSLPPTNGPCALTSVGPVSQPPVLSRRSLQFPWPWSRGAFALCAHETRAETVHSAGTRSGRSSDPGLCDLVRSRCTHPSRFCELY
jgi:hypothetical protein